MSDLEERTIGGLHDFLMGEVLPDYLCGKRTALDLGAGSGALSIRLARTFGLEVTAVDAQPKEVQASIPTVGLDLDAPSFANELDAVDLITAVEVIEHLESPTSFLRNVGSLLTKDGIAVITTPNVENLAARARFFLDGSLRMFDEKGNPTHITPVFSKILRDRILPLVPLRLVERRSYPERGLIGTRSFFEWGLKLMAIASRSELDWGDCHVFILERDS